MNSERAIDKGTAYGRPKPSYKKELTEVGPGTPMGELLRRYWHPIAKVEDATTTPRNLRILGEDLVLFRDGQNNPGLLHPNCSHRGTSLYYGKVEEKGIRCCYHGWLFDVKGNCLEQPCEPNGGMYRDKARQPWYPVQELYGLIWAYMGPPEKKPILPRYEALENLADDESLEVDDSSIGSGGPVVVDCNWFQHYENLVDPFHVVVLHSTFSGTQFVESMALMPDVSWETTELGVKTVSLRKLPDGKTFHRISEAVVPTLRVIPNPKVAHYGRVEMLGWILPIDDHHFRIYNVGRVKGDQKLIQFRSRLNGKLWHELTEEEHQALPGDYEAMVSQGKITSHSDEHLATTDRGIIMLRRYMLGEVAKVQRGEDPAGVFFDENTPFVEFEAGNYLIEK